MLGTPSKVPHDPPALTKGEIDAMAIGMRNRNQHYIGQLSSHPISLDEWVDREYRKHGYDLSDKPVL